MAKIKDIIKENRNEIVPSYEYRDYYREDGSRLYNSSREANWYKIGVHDGYEHGCNEMLDKTTKWLNEVFDVDRYNTNLDVDGSYIFNYTKFMEDFVKAMEE